MGRDCGACGCDLITHCPNCRGAFKTWEANEVLLSILKDIEVGNFSIRDIDRELIQKFQQFLTEGYEPLGKVIMNVGGFSIEEPSFVHTKQAWRCRTFNSKTKRCILMCYGASLDDAISRAEEDIKELLITD